MPATADELTLIRIAIGDSAATVYTDSELQLFWSDAVAQGWSESTQRLIIRYQTTVDALEGIMADAAKQTTYKSGEASENLSDIFKALKPLCDKYKAKLDAQIKKNLGSARIGVMRKVPRRQKDWPRS